MGEKPGKHNRCIVSLPGDVLALAKHTSATYWRDIYFNKNKVTDLKSALLENVSLDGNFPAKEKQS